MRQQTYACDKACCLTVAVITIAASVVFWIVFVVFVTRKSKRFHRYRRRLHHHHRCFHCSPESSRAVPAPRRFSYRDLHVATDGFADVMKLGEGRSSVVYKGSLSGRSYVAVKKLKDVKFTDEKDLAMEIAVLDIRHENLLNLQGWCFERGETLLVYDFLPGLSLQAHLFGSRRGCLSSQIRFKILQGICVAMNFLHENCILHRNLKSENVFLREGFEPVLTDVGIARLLKHEREQFDCAFMAPEVFYTGKATSKSDVYSFGILALEMASGRKAVSSNFRLVDWIWLLHCHNMLMDALDPCLNALDTQEQSSSASSISEIQSQQPLPTRSQQEASSPSSMLDSHQQSSMLDAHLQSSMLDSDKQSSMPDMQGVSSSVPNLMSNTQQQLSASLMVEPQQASESQKPSPSSTSSFSYESMSLAADIERQWRCVIHVALLCCHPLLEARPTMAEVAMVLQESKVLPLPASTQLHAARPDAAHLNAIPL